MFCRHRGRHHDNGFHCLLCPGGVGGGETRRPGWMWGRHLGEQSQGGGSDFKMLRARLSSFLPTVLLWSFQRTSGQLCGFFPHYHVHLFPVIAVPNEPQVQYLKTTQIYCLPVLEVSLTGLKASLWQGEYLLEALKKSIWFPDFSSF